MNIYSEEDVNEYYTKQESNIKFGLSRLGECNYSIHLKWTIDDITNGFHILDSSCSPLSNNKFKVYFSNPYNYFFDIDLVEKAKDFKDGYIEKDFLIKFIESENSNIDKLKKSTKDTNDLVKNKTSILIGLDESINIEHEIYQLKKKLKQVNFFKKIKCKSEISKLNNELQKAHTNVRINLKKTLPMALEESKKNAYIRHDAIFEFLNNFCNDFIAKVKEFNKEVDDFNSEVDREYENYLSSVQPSSELNEKEKYECQFANKAWNSLLNANVIFQGTCGENFLKLFDNYIVKNEYDLMNAVNDIIEKKNRRDYERSQIELLEESNEAQNEAERNRTNTMLDIEIAKLKAELNHCDTFSERRKVLEAKILALEKKRFR